ncbi:MAG: vitamin K epoxide reductase family protein, partial [Byssovorax sp.]
MSGAPTRWPAAVALAASLLGLTFAGLSSVDYTKHLDRQIHDVHCSYVPGLGAETSADNACRVAMYSPFAALFRDKYWGGVPIALFAVGSFCFFAAFALYLLLAGRAAPRRAPGFFALVSVTPLLASIVMGTISAVRLGHFCKVCV